MRQLKNFMKAKKPMWKCGECECITLKCWRENDTFCNCGTSSEGLGVEYAFKNWDGTILKKGSIDEGATPKAPANPTREATAEYTYTFAGWDPEVGPISEDTVYTATYTSTVNQYTVSIAPNDVSYGTVDENSITVDYGTAISVEGNVLTIGTENITATAETGYVFSSWGELPETVTGNLSITATFETEVAVVTFSSKCIDGETEEEVVGGPTTVFTQNSITVPVDTTIEAIWSGGEPGEGVVVGLSFSTGDSVTWTAPAVADGYGYNAGDPIPSGDIEADPEIGVLTVKGDGDIEVDAWRIPVALITIESNDESKGTVDIESVYGRIGSHIGESDNTLNIDGFIDNQLDAYTVTATSLEGATFKEWQGLPEGDIEGPITITAVFEAGR